MKLTVISGAGVEGYPKPGEYEYDTGMVVNYGYRALEGYINLVTTLDGKIISMRDHFFIRKDNTLKSEAEQKVLWRYNTSTPVYYSIPAVGSDNTILFHLRNECRE